VNFQILSQRRQSRKLRIKPPLERRDHDCASRPDARGLGRQGAPIPAAIATGIKIVPVACFGLSNKFFAFLYGFVIIECQTGEVSHNDDPEGNRM